MAMDQGLYSQVVMLLIKNLNITEANKNKNEDKFKFHGQSTRSQRWFDPYFGCIEEKSSTREPDFYMKIYQRHDKTQDTNELKMFEVPIGNKKCVEEKKFHSKSPMLKYCQNSLNSCCFGSLASSFDSINQTKANIAISIRIEEPLKSQVGNCIDFSNYISKNKKRVKGEHKLYYSMKNI